MVKRSSELTVFKGPKKRLNLAIFLVLFIAGPLPEHDIHKQVEELGWVYDGSLYRSLSRLVGFYLKILPPKKGSKAQRYDLTDKARWAMFLEFFDKQTLMDRANERDASFLLARTLRILRNNSDQKEPELILKKRILNFLNNNSKLY